MRRIAEKAGSWYAGDADGLASEVGECLAAARERYGRAIDEAAGTPVGVVVPHAGLFFSGAVAAAAFDLVRRRRDRVDAFLVFGACHTERLREPAVWAAGAWETPLGPVEVDEELARALLDAGVGRANYRAHEGDNAIELQVPFIRHCFPEAKIVPVAMGPFPAAGDMGRAAANAVAESGRVVVGVASTDLTHYGRAFGLMPAGTGAAALRWIRDNDMRFLDAALALDSRKMLELASRDHSACGAGAAAALAGWSAALGCLRGRLLAYANSHEIMPRGEAEHVVGYGAVVYAV